MRIGDEIPIIEKRADRFDGDKRDGAKNHERDGEGEYDFSFGSEDFHHLLVPS